MSWRTYQRCISWGPNIYRLVTLSTHRQSEYPASDAHIVSTSSWSLVHAYVLSPEGSSTVPTSYHGTCGWIRTECNRFWYWLKGKPSIGGSKSGSSPNQPQSLCTCKEPFEIHKKHAVNNHCRVGSKSMSVSNRPPCLFTLKEHVGRHKAWVQVEHANWYTVSILKCYINLTHNSVSCTDHKCCFRNIKWCQYSKSFVSQWK